ncbi:hypothetical protein, variant [Exophiala mesophila]|uniref:Cell pattern formation-associated protein STUA n=1 Tax=Exophiala mesophila TaxID=212818 RepID=A0A0D1XS56_EXOME|nr:uncharacterized protein PV10_05546 [Exophiala mesophila]XP_016222521.1 hypothetical protein, variant [Exophiala mesophila]KIV90946.1 hypothetical protein PV10_05546 [Exophiala mesophila]KIV90947.1 hypothetical protein, variant [Exophiala mesophila]
MNQTQSYMDMHPGSHISSGPSYSHSAPAPIGHYQQYQQPPVIPPASQHYGQPQTYGSYAYTNGVTSPQSTNGPVGQQIQPQNLSLPAMITPSPQHYSLPQTPNIPTPSQAYPQPSTFDTTGQVAPPGSKPRVTATLWEDEGSLCFQVEARGVCVARREDNHFINGTKLLNVAGMTRGRRDGILKAEKTRHVVKIGPMHLKGVWIPFERALDFANKEKITDQLYPLFVHNIGGLLYNPENAPRTNAVAASAAERRRLDSVDAGRPAQAAQTPSLHHHHSMQGGAQGPPTPHSIAPHPNAGRPGIDRAHTFPTPPTSASSVMGMSNQGTSYDWGNQNISNGATGPQPLSIDTGINARSMPTTPATTPPGNGTQGMQQYQTQAGYDSKHYYSTTPSSQTGFAQHPDGSRYGHSMPPAGYGKSDMGPPTAPGNAGAAGDGHDHKPDAYSHVTAQGHPAQHENDHSDSGYMSATASGYTSNRSQYGYSTAPEHSHLSPELSGSPHQNGSGHATPRTLPPGQPQWTPDYHTPPRPGSSNLYSVMGSRTPVGTGPADGYPAYPNAGHPATLTSAKRGREDDDQDRPGSRDYDGYDSKRRKLGRPEAFGMPLNSTAHMQAIKTGGQR